MHMARIIEAFIVAERLRVESGDERRVVGPVGMVVLRLWVVRAPEFFFFPTTWACLGRLLCS